MGVFCGFLVVFCVGVGESWEGWEVLEYVKGFILWGYESININFLSWKEQNNNRYYFLITSIFVIHIVFNTT